MQIVLIVSYKERLLLMRMSRTNSMKLSTPHEDLLRMVKKSKQRKEGPVSCLALQKLFDNIPTHCHGPVPVIGLLNNSLTHSQRVGECGRMLTDTKRMHTVDSYTTTESDKTGGITKLLLSSGENKSLDLTIMGSINTPITKRKSVG